MLNVDDFFFTADFHSHSQSLHKLSDTVNIISQHRWYSMEFMEFAVILVQEKTTFKCGAIKICPEAASAWVEGDVEGFGQVSRVVVISHCLGLYP